MRDKTKPVLLVICTILVMSILVAGGRKESAYLLAQEKV